MRCRTCDNVTLMTEAMLEKILSEALTKADKDGLHMLSDGRRLTLYASHGGVGLTVAKVESVKVDSGIVRARNDKGETFLLSVEDVFAAAVEAGGAGGPSGRKAGFMG